MIYKLTQTSEAKSVNFQSVNTCNQPSGNYRETDGMIVPRDSRIMTTACRGFLMSYRTIGLDVRHLKCLEHAGVGGRPRNRGGKCSRAEPLRGGDAKLPAQTAFEQRVAGLPISSWLIDMGTVHAVPAAQHISRNCLTPFLEMNDVFVFPSHSRA